MTDLSMSWSIKQTSAQEVVASSTNIVFIKKNHNSLVNIIAHGALPNIQITMFVTWPNDNKKKYKYALMSFWITSL